MKIALISDIHSNFDALRSVLDYGQTQGVDQYVCLGDVVGYGADPNPCCDLLRQVCVATLMGNHDAAVIGMMDTDYYYNAARHAIYWTRQQLSKENFEWLYRLPYTYQRENLGFYHSAPILPSAFYYVVRQDDAAAHLRMFDRLSEFSFVGHSHLTSQYQLTEKKAKDVTGRVVTAKPDRKWIINVGSVGQPRDRDNRACFGIFDTEKQEFRHHRVEYDIERSAERIVSSGLDEKFARRLFVGL